MHAKILEGIKAEYSRLVWRSRGEVVGVGLLSCGVAGGMVVAAGCEGSCRGWYADGDGAVGLEREEYFGGEEEITWGPGAG